MFRSRGKSTAFCKERRKRTGVIKRYCSGTAFKGLESEEERLKISKDVGLTFTKSREELTGKKFKLPR